MAAVPATDVLIVGAGPTGLTLATALETRGIRTTVIDREVAGANTSRAAVVGNCRPKAAAAAQHPSEIP